MQPHEISGPPIDYRVNPQVTNQALNTLFAGAWPGHQFRDFAPALTRSLGYVCAYQRDQLVGFVNVAWDGGKHAFLLDTTVRTDRQRKGIGLELVHRAGELAYQTGAQWLHVDYAAYLSEFYEKCGFQKAEAAGLIRLRD